MSSRIDENLVYEYVGKKIREFREKDEIHDTKITQEVLANEIGVSRVSVANYETGKQAIYLSDLFKIADYLKLDIKEFLPPINIITIRPPEEKLESATDLTIEAKEAIKNIIENVN